jgi:hypothetical protein
MTAMDRRMRGEARSRHFGKGLSDDDVRAIRALPGPLRTIGAQFNISAVMVHFIKKRRKWAHVQDMAAEETG